MQAEEKGQEYLEQLGELLDEHVDWESTQEGDSKGKPKGKDGAPTTQGSALKSKSYQQKVKQEKEIQKKLEDEESRKSSDDKIIKVKSNEDVKIEVENIQSDLQQKRDMGTAGAGGPVASQGESRYCNTMNTFKNSEFKEKNKESISYLFIINYNLYISL